MLAQGALACYEAPMVGIPTEAPGLRPAFLRALASWTDVSVVTKHPHLVTIRRQNSGAAASSDAALLVIGENRLDQTMFERCATHTLIDFLERGWSVSVIDYGIEPKLSKSAGRTHSQVIAEALADTERLRYVTIYTHSRYAINLSETGDDLVAGAPKEGAETSLAISDLRLCASAAADGWVDLFGCLCRNDALWPNELADTLGWPVRTVYPGYSIYFPPDADQPKSSIPFTKFLAKARYIKRAWAVWLPNRARPIRVSEPSRLARRYSTRFDAMERWITEVISVGLEPVRDFRKRRLFAAQSRRQRDTHGA